MNDFEDWIATKKREGASVDFTDAVMKRVRGESSSASSRTMSGWKVAAGIAALAIGLSRFVYLAKVAGLIAL